MKATVQCSYYACHSHVETVEGETIDELVRTAIEAANESGSWDSSDHCGNTQVDAIALEADTARPMLHERQLPVPLEVSDRESTELTVIELPRGIKHEDVDIRAGIAAITTHNGAVRVTRIVDRFQHRGPKITIRLEGDREPVITVGEGGALIEHFGTEQAAGPPIPYGDRNKCFSAGSALVRITRNEAKKTHVEVRNGTPDLIVITENGSML